MTQKAEKKRKFRNDMLLAAVILATATVAFFLFRKTMTEGSFVVVTVDGTETHRLSLKEEQELVITTGFHGENILIIEDGKAKMQKANCPDGICVEHRPISKTGETIVCLPHEIVISIEGEGDEEIIVG